MKEFYQDDLYISKINACVFVASGTGIVFHRNRPSHGLVINLNGENQYVFEDGCEHHVRAEELFYLPKYSTYDIKRASYGDCIAVNFDLADPSITYPFFSLPADSGHKYVSEFQQLLQEWNSRSSGYMNRCISHLYHIICLCQRDKAQQYIPVRNRKLANDGANYIALHLSDPTLSIANTASALGITPEYFRKLFRQSYGFSPKQHILNLRMEKARELIASGELRIGAIAQMCGYEDENYFSREFKRLNSCPPTHFVRK